MKSQKIEGEPVVSDDENRLQEKRQLVRNLPEFGTDEDIAKGYFNPKITRMVFFHIIIISILFAVVIAVAGIWEFLEPQLMIKALSSFGVIVIGTFIFNVVNEYFGE